MFKERSKEGRERYLSEGKVWGRKKIEIEPRLKSQVIRRYNSGVGTKKLSRFLAKHGIVISPSTVWRRLKNWGVDLREL